MKNKFLINKERRTRQAKKLNLFNIKNKTNLKNNQIS